MKIEKALIGIVFLFYVSSMYGQRLKMETDHRQVVINYPDSIVTAEVLVKEKRISVQPGKVYYWYNSNSIHKNAGGFTGNVLDGTYQVFDKNKNLIVQGEFRKGLRIGTWNRWNPKGGVYRTECWRKGILHGSLTQFNHSGDIIKQLKFKNGELHGKSRILEKGRMKTVKYNRGVIDSTDAGIHFFKKSKQGKHPREKDTTEAVKKKKCTMKEDTPVQEPGTEKRISSWLDARKEKKVSKQKTDNPSLEQAVENKEPEPIPENKKRKSK